KDINVNGVRKIIQRGGLFEEAINEALSEVDGDLALFTDDDAIPSKNWVEDHVSFFERYPDACIASGKVIGRMWKNYPNALFERFNGTKFMKPLSSFFSDYSSFVTVTGLSVDARPRSEKVEKSVAISGVNMSLNMNVFHKTTIPTFTLRGSYNETSLTLIGSKKGYHSYIFEGGEVMHGGEESLSRTQDPIVEKYLCLEKHVFPFAVNKIMGLSSELLKEFIDLLEDGVPKIGLELALKGITQDWNYNQFRQNLQKLWYEIKNKKLDEL
ncbi:glycosyltransferase family A protein, partial [Acidianus sp. RZ1]